MSSVGNLIRHIASKIPDDVDLSDDGDVIRALYAAGFALADYELIFDEVIAKARASRRRERRACAAGLIMSGIAAWLIDIGFSGHAWAADGPVPTWQGDLLFPALGITFVCVIAWFCFAISGAHAEREDADDLAALRRGRDEPGHEGFGQ